MISAKKLSIAIEKLRRPHCSKDLESVSIRVDKIEAMVDSLARWIIKMKTIWPGLSLGQVKVSTKEFRLAGGELILSQGRQLQDVHPILENLLGKPRSYKRYVKDRFVKVLV